MTRRTRPIRLGNRARPRVANSDSTIAINPPIKVDAAAMLTVSINEGRNLTIRPGIRAAFSAASETTSPGNWKMFPIPSQNPPALRLSASMKPDAISATKTTSMMPP